MIEQRHLATYLELFCPRRDLYARQTKRGSYFLTRSQVTQEVVANHLKGGFTAGFYPLTPDNTLRWVVLDADRADGLEQLQESWRVLEVRGISAYLELSRRGGVTSGPSLSRSSPLGWPGGLFWVSCPRSKESRSFPSRTS